MRPPPAVRLLALALVAAATRALVAAARRRPGRWPLTTVEVAGRSMSPALLPGDYLLLRRRPLPPGETAFGHIVAMRDGERRLLLKRVVGLPGESLQIGADIHVDGRRLLEPYARWSLSGARRQLRRMERDELFLLGDRREASTDSRDFGPVHGSAIEGVSWFRYWPPGRIGPLRPEQRRFSGEGETTQSARQ